VDFNIYEKRLRGRFMITYYIIDTETTGLKSGYNEMTEIGIIRVSDRVQLWRQIKCEYPERANFDALAITKKTLADLDKGYDKIDIVNECEKFFQEDGLTPAHRCIVAHNAQFDRKFLHALWGQVGKSFPAHLWLCTMALSREYAKSQGLMAKGMPKQKVNLHAACDLVKINKLSEAHNAKVDSRNTYLLYKNLVDEKKVNYLPFIKTEIHYAAGTAPTDDTDGLDPSLND
jgi:DNA polymerase III epsilon subunit-like protein